MTNREKIMAIIKQANDELHSRFVEGVMRVRNGEISRFTTRDVKSYGDILADKLIEAGIGDCAELTEKWRAMLETQAKKTEEAEHRAEVAERAVREFAAQVGCRSCPYKGRCGISNPSAENDYQECYEAALRIAEKDLAEEKKQ